MIEEGNILTFDQLSLYTRSWLIDEPVGDIFFVHGFMEHCQRYDAEASFFNSHGFNFYSYDQRTHGKSDGPLRSFIKPFDNYLKDYDQFLSTKIKNSQRPFFLFSHSMGGLVQLSHLLKQPIKNKNFKGALFSSPFIKASQDVAPMLQKVAGIIGTLFPKLKTVKADPSAISRDQQEVDKYINDPLIYTEGLYAASGKNLLKQIKKVTKDFDKFDVPFIIQHGTDDKLAEIQGSKDLIKRCSSKDAVFIELSDFKHEITRDIGKEDVMTNFLNWMKERF